MSDTTIDPNIPIKNKGGRPKKVAVHEDFIPMPGGPKKVRNRRASTGGVLDISREIIDVLNANEIDLQWIATSVVGNDQIVRTQVQGYRQDGGWEPVTADMFPYKGKPIFAGMYYDIGYNGQIEVGGQVLHWRPMELTRQALKEMAREAAKPIEATRRDLVAGRIEGTTGAVTTSTPAAKAWQMMETSIEDPRIPIPD